MDIAPPAVLVRIRVIRRPELRLLSASPRQSDLVQHRLSAAARAMTQALIQHAHQTNETS
jgi:hypothetical protein